MRDFFKNKKNLIFVILLGVSLLGVLIASFWEGFTPISCMLFGVLCIYMAYLFALKHVKLKSVNIDEFVSEENTLKRKTTKFLQSENKLNTILLAVLFLVMGALLIYFSLQMFIA